MERQLLKSKQVPLAIWSFLDTNFNENVLHENRFR